MLDVTKDNLLTFKGICMDFYRNCFVFYLFLSHPVTSKQPLKIVQLHMGHLVFSKERIENSENKLDLLNPQDL